MQSVTPSRFHLQVAELLIASRRIVQNDSKLTKNQEYDLLIVDYDGSMETSGADTEDESGWNCSIHPSVFFLLATLTITTCATAMLCGSIMTDYWEEVTWNKQLLQNATNSSYRLQWFLDGLIARVSTNDARDLATAFLVPMHGGIWTLCVSLTGNGNSKDVTISPHDIFTLTTHFHYRHVMNAITYRHINYGLLFCVCIL